jgi:hypothetical protein
MPEYGLVAKRNVVAGLLDTYVIMYPQLAELDLRQEVPRLEVPVYLVQGELEAPGRDDLTDPRRDGRLSFAGRPAEGRDDDRLRPLASPRGAAGRRSDLG